MRKIISAFLAVALMVSLCGCQLLCSHEWNEATCTTPKTCTKCGKVEGNPLGHSGTEFNKSETNYLTATDKLILNCDLCGDILEEKEEPSTTFINDGFFGFTCEEFVSRLENIFENNYGDTKYGSSINLKYSIYESYVIFDVYYRGDLIGWGCFFDAKGDFITESNEYDRTVREIDLFTYYNDEEDEDLFFAIHKILLDCISMTIDPTIKNSKFKDSICGNSYSTDKKALHNIYYSSSLYKNEKFLSVVEIDAEAFA